MITRLSGQPFQILLGIGQAGAVRMMTAENVTLNGGAVVTGDLLVPKGSAAST